MRRKYLSIYPCHGQILMEAVWLILFSCAFLAMLSHLYEKGKKEIKSSRFSYIKDGNLRSPILKNSYNERQYKQ
ncbi:MAG: hypothetical protein F4X95_01665 [Oligoflexia bacterium]|nr:hypothetical protein [Bdellovibrionales bacterium]MYE07446.1 hypothetical protein [Oligoflexia bacterium]